MMSAMSRPRTAQADRSNIMFIDGTPIAAGALGPPSGRPLSSHAPGRRRIQWAPHLGGVQWGQPFVGQGTWDSPQLPAVAPRYSESSGGLADSGQPNSPSSVHIGTSVQYRRSISPRSGSSAFKPGEDRRLKERQQSENRSTEAKREREWDEGLKKASRGLFSGNVIDSQFHFGETDTFRRWEVVGNKKDGAGCGFFSKVDRRTDPFHPASYSYAPKARETDRYSLVKYRTKEDQTNGIGDTQATPFFVYGCALHRATSCGVAHARAGADGLSSAACILPSAHSLQIHRVRWPRSITCRGASLPPPRRAVLDPYDAKDGCQ